MHNCYKKLVLLCSMPLVPINGFKTHTFDVVDIDKDNDFATQAKAMGIEFSPNDRIFRSVVQAGVIDRQGDLVDQQSFMKAMGDWRDNKGAILRYYHQPEHIVGRGLLYKGIGFKGKDGKMIQGIEYIGRIDRDNEMSDFVWDGILKKSIRGSSFGGGHKKGAYIRNNDGGFGMFATDMFVNEISLCPEPVNQFALIMDHNEMAKALAEDDYTKMDIDMVKSLEGKEVGRIVCQNSRCMVKAMKNNESDLFSEKNVSIKSKYENKKNRMGEHDMDAENEIKKMKDQTKSMEGKQEKSLNQIEALEKTVGDQKSMIEGMNGTMNEMKSDIGTVVGYLKKGMEEDEKKPDGETKEPEGGDTKPAEPPKEPKEPEGGESDPPKPDEKNGGGDSKGYPETGNLEGKGDQVKLPTEKNGSEEARKLATDPHPQGKSVVGGTKGDMEKALVINGVSTFVTPAVSGAMAKAMGDGNDNMANLNIVTKSNHGLLAKADVASFGKWIRAGSWRPKFTENERVQMGFENMGAQVY